MYSVKNQDQALQGQKTITKEVRNVPGKTIVSYLREHKQKNLMSLYRFEIIESKVYCICHLTTFIMWLKTICSSCGGISLKNV